VVTTGWGRGLADEGVATVMAVAIVRLSVRTLTPKSHRARTDIFLFVLQLQSATVNAEELRPVMKGHNWGALKIA
jgi:hypothetical protein